VSGRLARSPEGALENLRRLEPERRGLQHGLICHKSALCAGLAAAARIDQGEKHSIAGLGIDRRSKHDCLPPSTGSSRCCPGVEAQTVAAEIRQALGQRCRRRPTP